jgi:hypothetical protein
MMEKKVSKVVACVKKIPIGPSDRCSTWVCFNLNYKYGKRLERLARDKHSSLFSFFVGDEEKKVFKILLPGSH